jgi:hypothetical protein
MKADHLKQVVAKYFTDKLMAVNFEIGLCKHGRLRADVVAVNMRSEISIVEIKSSVADYRSDKKMLGYLKFCDKFYLGLAQEVYDKICHLVPQGVGIFIIDGSTTWIKKRATSHSVDPETRLNLVTRMAFRSADATRNARKSRSSGAQLVAETAVAAIQNMSPKDRKGNKRGVVKVVASAISKYV